MSLTDEQLRHLKAMGMELTGGVAKPCGDDPDEVTECCEGTVGCHNICRFSAQPGGGWLNCESALPPIPPDPPTLEYLWAFVENIPGVLGVAMDSTQAGDGFVYRVTIATMVAQYRNSSDLYVESPHRAIYEAICAIKGEQPKEAEK